MGLLDVAAAAAEIGVSPRRVRQMLADGTLTGQRISGVWALDRQSVDMSKRGRRPPHRPWSAASAWAVLALAAGEEPAGTATARSRARQRYARGLPELQDRLRARCRIRRFYVHPSSIPQIAALPGVIRTAASAAADHDLPLAGSGPLDVYVRWSDAERLLSHVPMEEGPATFNVCLRIVHDHCWPFPDGNSVAPLPVVAVDLADSLNARERRLGAELLDGL